MDFNLAPLPPGVAESDHPPVRHEQAKATDRLNHGGGMAKTRKVEGTGTGITDSRDHLH